LHEITEKLFTDMTYTWANWT